MKPNDLTVPPPFNPPPEPAVKIATDSPTLSRSRREPTKASNLRVVVLLGIVVALGYIAWPILTGIRAENVEQQWAMDWVYENEGDPGSVEWVALEGPDNGFVLAKYRCTGPMGGPIVQERVFRVEENGVYYNSHFLWHTEIKRRNKNFTNWLNNVVGRNLDGSPVKRD